MNGTEKQVAWATEIKDHMIETLEKVMVDAKRATEETGNPLMETTVSIWLEAAKEHDIAGDFIDCFGDITWTGDHRKDFSKMAAYYKITTPMTTTAHSLLCK